MSGTFSGQVIRRPSGYKADQGLNYATIEQVMKTVRAVLSPNTRPHEPLNMLWIFERLHEHTVSVTNRNVRLSWGVEQLPKGVEGRCKYDEENDEIVVELSPETYEALEIGQPRAVTTVGHEIAHSFFHAEQLVRISQIPHVQMALARVAGPLHRHYEDTEWQANAGAAALTMPAAGLQYLERQHGVLTASIVQKTYGVSASAATNRLKCFTERRIALL